ncbi:nitrous oxide reductase accessory protein NosL [Pseudomonas fluorescens]|uniref:Nitrous oxide reductase accessory protein NosL n=1 Tax=Pseudomonas fluorescens TaxID=294 RepID=A0A944HE41_PSEFL|nr:nitrous oxide reductase accessory protein NosL [Pseudomonas fluorescens]MBT2295809.1 nitrous oxide reductase accessory protein NosL [Pseudomonas fluorescens]MBT2306066.1 nitrous oxide reductase accessory protein NosL [Pseudomonas fluorescens]MBT2314577.1 nitrous oxide reductase accessory protein NosL [Pseudomonas fluorescens]MBT2315674.1 nitrous oxide reductase accessory protein NosL [Pseudomonas fluorescens]MBT2327114.1 nitrous oxide reductase accessory protein NosL [Pseudomonas fluorescen
MNRVYVKTGRWLAGVLVCLALVACDKTESAPAAQAALAFHPSDECHVCGMVITDFPGPKGAAVAAGGVKKFCSPAEMLGWWLQPENHRADVKLYVHDMGRSHWNTPDDEHLIDARSAYFVLGSGLKGAMGMVLASFSDAQAAEKLARDTGGRVLRLEDIDQKLLGQATAMSPMSH